MEEQPESLNERVDRWYEAASEFLETARERIYEYMSVATVEPYLVPCYAFASGPKGGGKVKGGGGGKGGR